MKVSEAMHKIAYSFISSSQFPVQGALYHCFPELWFTKCLFANTNILEEKYWILKTTKQLEGLPYDSTGIYRKGKIECYIHGPEVKVSSLQHIIIKGTLTKMITSLSIL